LLKNNTKCRKEFCVKKSKKKTESSIMMIKVKHNQVF
jgi:hypothetical protein